MDDQQRFNVACVIDISHVYLNVKIRLIIKKQIICTFALHVSRSQNMHADAFESIETKISANKS